MAKLNDCSAQSATPRETAISPSEELTLLRMEYERMAAEIRMYVSEYNPKLTVFGTFVTGAITFAWGDSKYNLVYPLIPYFLFLIAGITMSQAYIITCLAERVRQIEARIAQMNGGHPILNWESVLALKLIYPAVLRVPKKGGGLYIAVNPILCSVVLMILAVVPVVGFCLYRTWALHVIPGPASIIYIAATLSFFLIILIMSFSWFRLANIMTALDFETGN